jgi:hypothetical protein
MTGAGTTLYAFVDDRGMSIVDATQFTLCLTAAEATALAGQFGGTFSCDHSYWAIDLPAPGHGHARPGDYLVRDSVNEIHVMDAAVFETKYALAGPPGTLSAHTR